MHQPLQEQNQDHQGNIDVSDRENQYGCISTQNIEHIEHIELSTQNPH